MADTELRKVNPLENAKVRSSFGPTEAGQKWLDEHPEEAQKGVNYVPKTFIPFPKVQSNLMSIPGVSAVQELGYQTMSEHNTRGTISASSPFHPPGSIRTDILTGHCTRVRWAWNDTLAKPEGYELTIDGKRTTFSDRETEDIIFRLPRAIFNANDHIDVDWVVTYKSTGELIEIKEPAMTDKPAEKTGELNDALGRHWADNADDYKTCYLSLKRNIIHHKLHIEPWKKLGKDAKAKEAATNVLVLASIGLNPDQKLTDSKYDSFATALAAAEKWADEKVANAPKPEVPEHEHIFETAKCKVCNLHWSKVEKIKGALHIWIDETFANRNPEEKTHDAQYQFVKECNGVKHLEETDLTFEKFKQEAFNTIDAMYPLIGPDTLAKELWAKWLPEFKTINPDVTEKAIAMKMIIGLFGDVENLSAVVANIGVEGAQKTFDENKHILKPKPALPKGTNGNGNHSDVSKPQNNPQYQPPAQPPVSNAVATVPSSFIPITSPELAALEAKKQEAMILVNSGLLPKSVNTPEKVIVIGMMGEALGIEKIVALNMINVVQGKPSVSPQLMLALIKRSSVYETMSATDDGNTCTVKMKRKGEDEHIETFSMDDAKKMGLAGNDNWVKQAKTMRKWRAVAAACRVVFPDVIWGLYTTEELEPESPNTVDAEFVEAA